MQAATGAAMGQMNVLGAASNHGAKSVGIAFWNAATQ